MTKNNKHTSQLPFRRTFQDRAVGPPVPPLDTARKYDKVGIPVEKNAKKSLLANVPDGTWCRQSLGRPTTLAGPGLVSPRVIGYIDLMFFYQRAILTSRVRNAF